MAPQTLSVRLPEDVRLVLEEAASEERLAGPSALASAILSRWVRARVIEQTVSGVRRAATYLRVHPEGWDDDPADFFPEASER